MQDSIDLRNQETPADFAASIRPANKVVVILLEELATWQELNVTAFLISGIATCDSGLTGRPYEDRDGNRYLPMLRQPVIVMTSNANHLATIRSKGLQRDMSIAIYTRELFATSTDEANRAAVANGWAEQLDLVGVAIYGPRNAVDRLTKGAALHG
ncbi:DUF2000 family protein [Vibrio cholerae]|nr:DUF2000 family protein [Vibrio cholerae]